MSAKADLTRYVVQPSGCWEWTGSRNRKGYGRAQVNRVHMQAHRAVYMAHHGLKRLPARTHVHHTCHNRACVNPAHMQLVDVTTNNRRKTNNKLTERTAAAVRMARGTHASIASRYGIARQTVGDIKNGRRWAS